MPSPGPVAGRKCLVWTSLWLGPLFLVWGGFIVLSHQPGLGAITWGRWLFGWLVLLSYVMVWGWAIGMTPQPRLTLFRAIACTCTLAGILLCLELPVLLKLVHWRVALEGMDNASVGCTIV